MKNCAECLNSIEDNMKFCGKCGTEVNNDYLKIREDIKFTNNQGMANTEYFAIPIWALVVFSSLSFGIFNIYWFYKNWKAIKIFQNKKTSPILSSIFSVLTCYGLSKEIFKSAKENNYSKNYSPALLAWGYFLLNIFTLGFLSFIPLVVLQNAINYNNKKIQTNKFEFSPVIMAGIACIIIGFLLVIIRIAIDSSYDSTISNIEYVNQVVVSEKSDIIFPKQISEYTKLINIKAENNAVRYYYTFSGLDTSNISNYSLKNSIALDICKILKDSLFARGISAEFSYTNTDTGENYFITVNNEDCN